MNNEMIIIYAKENEFEFKTMLIRLDEQMPVGWVDDPEKLGLKVIDSAFSRIKEENKILSEAIEDLAEVSSNQDAAILDIAKTLSDIVESKGGEING